jgi:hypothetical protein
VHVSVCEHVFVVMYSYVCVKYIWTCMRVNVYMCECKIWTCMYMYVHMYVCASLDEHVWVCACIWTCVRLWVCTWMWISEHSFFKRAIFRLSILVMRQNANKTKKYIIDFRTSYSVLFCLTRAVEAYICQLHHAIKLTFNSQYSYRYSYFSVLGNHTS